jgi:alpha-glucoside transport system permease protein
VSQQPLPAPILKEERPQRGLGTLRAGERFQGLLFTLPALVVLGIFLVYPAYYTTRLAFYKGDFLYRAYDFLGLDNFRELLTDDPAFLDLTSFPPSGALINNLRWVIFYITLSLVFGLGLAVLAVRVRYERIVKSIIFVPMAISATAVGLIWTLMYDPSLTQGTLNAFLHGIYHGFDPIAWVGRPSTVNYALIFAYVWASTGFAMVVLSAAIKGIPTEVIEAARVDGAGEWAIFRRVMVPMLSLPISVVTVWLFINVIKVFDIIYVMTGGGPGTSSRVIAYSMYKETFENGRGGYGAAIAVLMLILVLPVMVLNVRRFRSERVTG